MGIIKREFVISMMMQEKGHNGMVGKWTKLVDEEASMTDWCPGIRLLIKA